MEKGRCEGRLGTSAVMVTVAEALRAGEAASHRDYFTASVCRDSRWTAESVVGQFGVMTEVSKTRLCVKSGTAFGVRDR